MNDAVADAGPPARRNLLALKADCTNCFGLCCAALPFTASVDFAFDKAAGEPCRNLEDDFRCGIHASLREHGFRGCTVYDCFGAGQQVAQVTYGGTSWREAPDTAKQMFAVFPVMRQLHELLWYLAEALTLAAAVHLRPQLLDASDETERLTRLAADALLELDVDAHRAHVNDLLLQASKLVRKSSPRGPGNKKVKHGADLIGVNLSGEDLRGANFRGGYLIAADLRGANLQRADLIGVDLRDANLAGADLSTSLYLTQFQVNAARGDATTRLPQSLTRPEHWPT
ncbi:MAG: hypothetical protein QOF79_2005 [Actinomycetota bacterium]|jgi:uncharacterized protein YjbI with pentapeptide repeats|nr:hypothetical protein [Actinomycetota bacterium]